MWARNEGLRGVTEHSDWENWVLYVLRAVESTAQQTFGQVSRVRAAMARLREKVQREAPGVYSKDLIEVIFRQPYTKIQFLPCLPSWRHSDGIDI